MGIDSKKMVVGGKLKVSPLDELRLNEIDELKKIFFGFFVREVLDNKKKKSYEGPKYYERNPDEREFTENLEFGESEMSH